MLLRIKQLTNQQRSRTNVEKVVRFKKSSIFLKNTTANLLSQFLNCSAIKVSSGELAGTKHFSFWTRRVTFLRAAVGHTKYSYESKSIFI